MARARSRRPSLLSPVAYVRRAGIYKGLLGGSRGWLIAGGALMVAQRLKATFGRSTEIVTIEKLEPGQPIRLEAIRPPTRRERRAARR